MTRSVLTLGTFDGVHRGHQEIIARLVARARKRDARSVVLAFDLPPRSVLRKDRFPALLTTATEKKQILQRYGVDVVESLQFTPKLASTPAEQFFQEKIVDRYGAVAMVVGPRVAFGKNREGRLKLLMRLGEQSGVDIDVVRSIKAAREPVASRRIRQQLIRGNIQSAANGLGYPYSLSGKVVRGQQRGRTMGFPTANIAADEGKILPPGVFWVKVLPGDAQLPVSRREYTSGHDALCNIGTRPTFATRTPHVTCEVFIFGAKGSLYGRRLRVVFLKRIRSEKRFASVEALRAQIRRDFDVAQRLSRRALYKTW